MSPWAERRMLGRCQTPGAGSQWVFRTNVAGYTMIVSAALSLMLTLGAALVPPDGCSVVAAWLDGRAVAECADGETWFVYDPTLTRDGL
jgi:hypothetical protein